MGMRIDEKDRYKKTINRLKDDIERRNKEIQRERQKKNK